MNPVELCHGRVSTFHIRIIGGESWIAYYNKRRQLHRIGGPATITFSTIEYRHDGGLIRGEKPSWIVYKKKETGQVVKYYIDEETGFVRRASL